jgi:hypothetical protein
MTQRNLEDEDDKLFDELRRHVMENYPNPDRIGCLNGESLRLIVFNPSKVDPSDPRFVHLLRCSECTRDVMDFREERDRRARRRRLCLYSIAATVLLILAGVAITVFPKKNSMPALSPARVLLASSENITIDFAANGVHRGVAVPAPPGSRAREYIIPQRKVKLIVLLPQGSVPGKYELNLEQAPSGMGFRATVVSAMNQGGNRIEVPFNGAAFPAGELELTVRALATGISYKQPVTVR